MRNIYLFSFYSKVNGMNPIKFIQPEKRRTSFARSSEPHINIYISNRSVRLVPCDFIAFFFSAALRCGITDCRLVADRRIGWLVANAYGDRLEWCTSFAWLRHIFGNLVANIRTLLQYYAFRELRPRAVVYCASISDFLAGALSMPFMRVLSICRAIRANPSPPETTAKKCVIA